MAIINILKAILFGIIEGVTEWLPVSSTGHLILFEKICPLNMSSEFYSLFQVVIQFGAILAVLVIFFNRIWPVKRAPMGQLKVDQKIIRLWINILISCVPAAVIGLLVDDWIDAHFYNYVVVSIALVVVGVAFVYIEKIQEGKKPIIKNVSQITPRIAIYIGVFQLISALFPGTSRSGATILGALILGVSRKVAAEYTFYLAIPVMAGASFLKTIKYIVKYGFDATGSEMAALIIATIVSFFVSLLVIKGLMNFVKKHDFKVFGYYRIILGICVLLVFSIAF